METTVPVEVWTQVPWRHRSWKCRLGLHTHAELTDDDIASASQVCTACAKVSRFRAHVLIECIVHRRYLLVRENSSPLPQPEGGKG